MDYSLDAVFENGVLRPLQPLHLAENERVRVIVSPIGATVAGDDEWIDREALAWAELEGDASISIEEVRAMLVGIKGCFADSVIEERGEF